MDKYIQQELNKITLLQKKRERMECKREQVTCNGAFEIYTDIIKDIDKEISDISYILIFMEG